MANKLPEDGVNPIILDTTGATSAIARRIRILAVIWDSGASGSNGDQLILKTKSGGDVILSATLATAKDTLKFSLEGVEVDGIYLDTITHGTAYIYYK
jgi:hypothetical protein